MKTKLLHICFFVSMMSTGAIAQQNLFYNHYFINPYLYNPSYIAPSGYTELYLNYRKQWAGISGAPNTATLGLHVPLSHKAGVAFSASQDEAGFLKTTSGALSFAYQIYLGEKITDIHKISFGLSAGVMNSRIDTEGQGDLQDPVNGNSTSSLDGQFGIHYQYNGFRLGFSLPRIFETRVASEESFNTNGISQLNSTIASISYEFKFSPRVSLEPMFTYRTFENLDPQFEGLASLKLANVGWIGGAYRQDYGAAGFFGFNIKDKYKVGYAYEFATEQADRIGQGTHELQVILRLGRKHFARPHAAHKPPVNHTEHATTDETKTHKPIDPVEDEPRAEPVDQEVVEQRPTVEPEEKQPEVRQAVTEPIRTEPAKTPVEPQPERTEPARTELARSEPSRTEPQVQPVPEKPKQPVRNVEGGDLVPGHYVVVGAFENVQNAMNYQKTLKRSGYPAHVSFHPEKGYFIVHMDNVGSIEEARALRDKYRQMSRYSFRDTWILTIE